MQYLSIPEYFIISMWVIASAALITGLVLYKHIVAQIKTYTLYLDHWGESFKQKLLSDSHLHLSKESLELENSLLKEELKEVKSKLQLETSVLKDILDKERLELSTVTEDLEVKKIAYAKYKELVEADYASLQKTNDTLNSSLQSAMDTIAKTSGVVLDSSMTLVEFCDSVDSILDNLKGLDSPYEIGVHNGVVTITNTLLGTEKYPLIEPSDTHVLTMPKRDNKGRFLSFKARQSMSHNQNMQ